MVFDTERRYYVYLWKIKDTGEVFYVGKGTGNRYKTRKRENSFFMKMLNSHDCEPIIYKDNLTEEEAFELEKETIAYYRTTGCRLTNVLDGGQNPPKRVGKVSEEHRLNMCKAQQKYFSEHPEARKRNSEQLKRFLQTEEGKIFREKSNKAKQTDEFREAQRERSIRALNTPEFHKRHSELMRIVNNRPEMRARHQGANNCNAQEVLQYDLDGNFIKRYATVKEAQETTGVNHSKISAVARGERKTAGGYVWKYTHEPRHQKNKPSRVYDVTKDKSVKAVIQYDPDGNFIAEYPSIAMASNSNEKFDSTNIINNLKGRTKHAYGYVWKYKQGNTVPSQK